MSDRDRFLKRLFDIVGAVIGLVLVGWLILFAFILASIDTRKNGFFAQQRVGKDGKFFRAIKIRTMRDLANIDTSVTRANDPRITRLGRIWRKTKIDELPQLINVLLGQMSFVGPRPDVPGFSDQLAGQERIILSVRPGITGPATLRFRNEEQILAAQDNPEIYNSEVIWPEKVRLNCEYIEQYSFRKDLGYIWRTVVG